MKQEIITDSKISISYTNIHAALWLIITLMPVNANSTTSVADTPAMPCIANTWGETVSLLSPAGVEWFTYPDQQNRLYPQTPIEAYAPHHAQYTLRVYEDCTISLRAHSNGKLVAASKHPNHASYCLSANDNDLSQHSRYTVTDSGNGQYTLHPSSIDTPSTTLQVTVISHTPAAPASAVDTITTILRGTRAIPDPVETKIRALEQAGQLRILRVMESFPLQFEIEGSASVIQEITSLFEQKSTTHSTKVVLP